MTKGDAAIVRARSLIGTRFVAQGRDRQIGLDCVGLALLAYAVEERGIPDDYRLSGAHRAAILALATKGFRRVSRRRLRIGDMLLLRPGANQWHLGLWTGESVIHADAASRRVVERPGTPAWPIAAALRQRARLAKGS